MTSLKSPLKSPMNQKNGFIFPETNNNTPLEMNRDVMSHSKFNHNKLNTTIEENTQNHFEKSFEKSFNHHLHKINSRDTINSESTLVESLHNKNDSLNSINSTDTLNNNINNNNNNNQSYRLKRFNSASSVPSNILSPELINLSPNGSFNGSFNGSITGLNLSSPNNNTTCSSFQKKLVKFPIPEGLNIIDNITLSKIGENEDPLILDVRPFIEYNNKHIKNAINFNLPSTLLKRSNFTLSRCLQNLSITDNIKINKFLKNETTEEETGDVIIYDDLVIGDSLEISLAMYGTAMKFINDLNFHGKIHVLRNGFHNFHLDFPKLTEQSTISTTSTPSIKPPHNRSLSLANVSTPISPNLSRFQLPKLPKTPVFKIRHNEEFYDFDNYKIMNEFKFLNSIVNQDQIKTKLPSWIKNLLTKKNYFTLFEKFKNLEIEEKKRINSLIATNSVTSGIELGFKNRYKDIFPYEHSRVKLTTTPTSEEHNKELGNYINANFINCPSLTNLKYIATQAPLKETTKDFTKLCKDNDISLIISLTNQFENGIEKCYPYWDDAANFTILETSTLLPDFVIRRLHLPKYNRQVLQLQILNWSDFDIMLESQQIDVLKLIYLKRTILSKLHKQHDNVIVHCSAGCGRTGAFCTLDSIINSTEEQVEDPIFHAVERFRMQRISMVQNLRQYLFIYDCLLNYYENFEGFEKGGFVELGGLSIFKHFIEESKVNQST